MRITKCLRGLSVAGTTVITLCLAWSCTSCSPAGSRVSSWRGVASASPGEQLWASTLAAGSATAEAVSPDGTTLFVTGEVVRNNFETAAYRTATGARLWATGYRPADYSVPRAITASPDGATVYVTGGSATVAYDAGTGKQLWASRYSGELWALAVSPDSRTLYVTGSAQGLGSHPGLVTIAYAAPTGRRRWLRLYATAKYGIGESIAVSLDGKTVYVTGSDSSALTVAYQAAGNLKWAARYNNPYAGGAAASQIVTGAGGAAVYVVGRAANKHGHYDTATFAYSAATGKQLWLDRYNAHGGGGQIAVTPDGRSVIVAGLRNNGRTGGYLLASYNASTGATRWTRQAPASRYAPSIPAGLVIDSHGDTAFVASTKFLGGYDLAAWSLARGTVLWTSRYTQAKVYSPVAITLSGDGTRLFVTGSAGYRRNVMTTVAYQS